MIYRYKLKDELKDHRMSVNGLVVFKGKWFSCRNKIERLEPFVNSILDYQEITEADAEKEIAEENRILNERQKVKEIFKETSATLVNIPVPLEEPKQEKLPTIGDYAHLTKNEILEEIIKCNPEVYTREQFKYNNKQSLLESLRGIKGL